MLFSTLWSGNFTSTLSSCPQKQVTCIRFPAQCLSRELISHPLPRRITLCSNSPPGWCPKPEYRAEDRARRISCVMNASNSDSLPRKCWWPELELTSHPPTKVGSDWSLLPSWWQQDPAAWSLDIPLNGRQDMKIQSQKTCFLQDEEICKNKHRMKSVGNMKIMIGIYMYIVMILWL